MKSLRRLGLLFVLALSLGGVAPAETPQTGIGGATGAVGEEELETFVPTETLPADSSVSFPVDI